MSLAQQTADEARRRRIRLMRPPNAVADVEIDLRRKLMTIDAYRAMRREADGLPPLPAPMVPVEIVPVVPAIHRNEEIYQPPKYPTMKAIQTVICKAFAVKLIDLVSTRRTREVVRPRQIAMYLARTMTPLSFPRIGRWFVDRDHTTVLHGYQKIEGLRVTDTELHAQLCELETAIEGTVG